MNKEVHASSKPFERYFLTLSKNTSTLHQMADLTVLTLLFPKSGCGSPTARFQWAAATRACLFELLMRRSESWNMVPVHDEAALTVGGSHGANLVRSHCAGSSCPA